MTQDLEEWTQVLPVADLLMRSAALFPTRKALVMPEVVLEYAELRDASIDVARGIIALGIAPRSHIGILANNSRELVTGFFGAILANCVAVPLNARHKSNELSYIIENADLAAIITTAADTRFIDFRSILLSALPSLSEGPNNLHLNLAEAPLLKAIIVLEGEAPPGCISKQEFFQLAQGVAHKEVHHRRRMTRLRDTALIIYTSGTTANPKGCLLTHEAVTRGPVERAERRFRSEEHDITWGGGPLFHIGSLAPFIGVIGTGGTYLTDLVFDAGRALDLMEREGVTVAWPWFSAILQPLLDHPDFSTDRLAKLRKVLLIAAPALVQRVQDLFPETEFMQACGMTETAGIFALCGPDETAEQRRISQGMAVPGVEVKIIDNATGADLPSDAIGEILVRGYCVMEGYYRSPEKTAEAMDKDGWLHTGDLYARAADGRLTFHGRAKDMLKVGGENVAAIEVEAFLCNHPSVKIAEVIGRPDPRLDEVPIAFIELRPDMTASAEELIQFCQGKIASYKVPRAIFFVTSGEWPMSATKVNKQELRKRLAPL